jgi:hypothetical protein
MCAKLGEVPSPYEQTIENQRVIFFESSSEKDKRQYAAIEVLKQRFCFLQNIRMLHLPTIGQSRI